MLEQMEIRCPKLGGQVTFAYCLKEAVELPCPRIINCWQPYFPVEDYIRKRLTDADWDYLASLPEELALTIQGYKVLVLHGSPVSVKDPIYPSITPRGLGSKLGNRHPNILICGHTHIPFSKKLAGMLVVNAGAAGTSIDGDPRASYGIIDFEKGAFPRAAIVRFEYDYDSVANDVERRRVP